jgi:hypothetical protein
MKCDVKITVQLLVSVIDIQAGLIELVFLVDNEIMNCQYSFNDFNIN